MLIAKLNNNPYGERQTYYFITCYDLMHLPIFHQCPFNESDGRVRFTYMKLWNNDNMRTIFFIFGQYSSKEPIELDASFVRFIFSWYLWKVWYFVSGSTKKSWLALIDQMMILFGWSIILFVFNFVVLHCLLNFVVEIVMFSLCCCCRCRIWFNDNFFLYFFVFWTWFRFYNLKHVTQILTKSRHVRWFLDGQMTYFHILLT